MPSMDEIAPVIPDPTLMAQARGVSQQGDGQPGRYDHETSGSSDDSGSMSFLDIIDVINPLQHIPGVSTIYRQLTGDEISPAARVAGGTLYFGPIGFAISTINAVVETVTGDDVGGHVASIFGNDENDDGDETDVAVAGGPSGSGLAAGSDGPLSIEDWLKQPAPGTAEAAAAYGTVTAAAAPGVSYQQSQPERTAHNAPADATLAARAANSTATFPSNPSLGGSKQAIPIEALPADILAALMGGAPVRPIEPAPGTAETAPPDAGFGSLGVLPLPPAADQDMTPDPSAPLADGLAGLRPALATDVTAFQDADTFGQVAADGGWFTLAMSDALSRYDGGAALRAQAQRPLVDVSR